MPERLPWGRTRTLGALLSTTWLVIAHGPHTFASRVGIRHDERMIGYASAVAVVTLAPILLVTLLAAALGGSEGTPGIVMCCWVSFSGPVVVGAQLARGALYGALYHALARLLGGKASPGSSFSASFLSLGLFPVQLLLLACGMAPVLVSPTWGVDWLLGGICAGYLVAMLWGAALMVPHARERHGLSPGRAVFTALVPALLGLVPFALNLVRMMEAGRLVAR